MNKYEKFIEVINKDHLSRKNHEGTINYVNFQIKLLNKKVLFRFIE